MASAVIVYEQIETTPANAKALRSYVDKMITKGKLKNIARTQTVAC